MTVVVPTLAADAALRDCVHSLEAQTRRDFVLVIVDNSGKGLVRSLDLRASWIQVIENDSNKGFGGAVNQGFAASRTPFVATLNDDAVADPGWVEALLKAARANESVGMCASRVVLAPSRRLDSAGMLISGDGSSKQRGHLDDPEKFARMEEVLLPSGSAALYRREMLEQTGGFDDDFFLYCEDTDLGLRGRWAGWRCVYVPDAVVEHRYSHSAGRVSALKAYYVERNRLFLAIKNFPLGDLMKGPFVAITRYLWHLIYMLRGQGAAAGYRQGGSGLDLAWFVIKAHWAAFTSLPSLLKKRRAIRRSARITAREFSRLMRLHSISPRQVAAL